MSSISSMSKAKKKSKAPRFSSKMAEPSFEFKGSGYGAEMETPYEPPSKASYPSKSASSAPAFSSKAKKSKVAAKSSPAPAPMKKGASKPPSGLRKDRSLKRSDLGGSQSSLLSLDLEEVDLAELASKSTKDKKGKKTKQKKAQAEIPPDFRERFGAAYKQAMRQGGKAWNRSKLVFVGEGRAGKTSTLRSLLGKPYDPKQASTIGCDTDICTVDRSVVKTWEKFDQQGNEHTQALTSLAMSMLKDDQRDKKQATPSAAAAAEDPPSEGREEGEGEEGDVDVDPAISKLDDDFIFSAMEGQQKESITLTTWDYAGQRVFYTIHHLFLTNHGVYVIVFSMKKLLGQSTRPEALAYLRFWLNSIHMHAPQAPVLLVGTHKDVVTRSNDHKTLSALLADTFGHHPSFGSVVPFSKQNLEFFPLDNTKGRDDPVVVELQRAIEKHASESDMIQQNVPYTWLQLHDSLQNLALGKIDLEEFPEVSQDALLEPGDRNLGDGLSDESTVDVVPPAPVSNSARGQGDLPDAANDLFEQQQAIVTDDEGERNDVVSDLEVDPDDDEDDDEDDEEDDETDDGDEVGLQQLQLQQVPQQAEAPTDPLMLNDVPVQIQMQQAQTPSNVSFIPPPPPPPPPVSMQQQAGTLFDLLPQQALNPSNAAFIPPPPPLPSQQQQVVTQDRLVLPRTKLGVNQPIKAAKTFKPYQRLSFRDVCRVAAACGIPTTKAKQSLFAEVSDALRMFHELGSFVHYEDELLRDIVILDPQWLVDVISTIIRDHDTALHRLDVDSAVRKHKRDWELFQQFAILTETLLETFWQKYAADSYTLVCLLEKFGLLIPVRQYSSSASTTASAEASAMRYLVPNMLPKSSAKEKETHNLVCAEAMHTAYLWFGAPDPLSEPCVQESLPSGFLPEGLFPRLLGKVKDWSQHTFGFADLRADSADASFGNMKFQLTLDTERDLVCVSFVPQNPLPLLTRLHEFIDDIKSDCMPQLSYQVLIPYTAQSSAKYFVPLNHVEALVESQGTLWIEKKTISFDVFEAWLPSRGLLPSYDVFISYRVESDLAFVSALYDCLTKFAIGKEGRRLNVFFDKVRLEEGRRWDLDFMEAMCKSSIVVPVISPGALGRMAEPLDATKEDNLLLEWMLALHLVDAGRVERVVPVLLGEVQSFDKNQPAINSLFKTRAVKQLATDTAQSTVDRLASFIESPVSPVDSQVMPKVPSSPSLVLEQLFKFQALCTWTYVTDTSVPANGADITAESKGLMQALEAHQLWGVHETVASHLVKHIEASPSVSSFTTNTATSSSATISSGDKNSGEDTRDTVRRDEAAVEHMSTVGADAALASMLHSLNASALLDELTEMGVAVPGDLAFLKKKEVKRLASQLNVISGRKFTAAVDNIRKQTPTTAKSPICTIS
eukprot:m.246542 g.246542  ORF g.246542 m.246542 type:complete len:1402 (+) comp15381_c0_seq2:107-4312(+)